MSRPSSAGSTQQIPLQTLRSRFREAWTTHADPKGRVFSHGLISMLQQLNCFQTTINVGKREAPRYITFNAVPNDVMFLLKSLGYSDHEVAVGVYLEYPIMEKWYINQVRIIVTFFFFFCVSSRRFNQGFRCISKIAYLT